ncbi:MAG: hypothetical protein H6581_30120 [Bacteroidia bacterium]|nr:hypothetical protein [Bacteroidia bacterium]
MTVTVSFLSAVTLWFLVTLNSREYQARLDYPLKVVYVPEDVMMTSEIPPSVTVTSKGSGTSLLSEYFNFNRDTIRIDFRKHGSAGSFNYRGNLQVIQEAMPLGVEAIKISPEVIPLAYETRISKKVPVVNALEWTLPETYRLAVPPSFEPDSVKVLGPKNLLKGVKSWKTQSLNLELTPETRIKNIRLDTLAPFKVIPSSVLVTFQPIPYTETDLEIRITRKNVPDNMSLQLFPETVKVRVSIPFEKFSSLDESDIKLEVDYNRINPRNSFVIPQVRKLPAMAEILFMQPEKVEFLIVQEK